MTRECANALCGYFEALYDLNRDIITLCGVDVIDDSGHFEKLVDYVVFTIPRLVPFGRENGQYKIIKSDGLLEFSQDLPFLEDEYSKLLETHGVFLAKVKDIRNKLEHKMHAAEITSSGSGNYVLLDVDYQVDDKHYTIYAGEMIRFAKQMNEMLSLRRVGQEAASADRFRTKN